MSKYYLLTERLHVGIKFGEMFVVYSPRGFGKSQALSKINDRKVIRASRKVFKRKEVSK